MKDTIIIFDNTKGNNSFGKIQGSYKDVLIGFTTLIYQTAIKTNKRPADIALDLLDVVRNNEITLYTYMKNNKELNNDINKN